jgi:adenosylmethionine-8-amino-7-oxononanoate aminotransferase
MNLLPPGLTRVLLDDGSTAVEVALKMALQFWSGRGGPGDYGARARITATRSVPWRWRAMCSAPFAEHLFEVARLPDPSSDAGGAATIAALDRLLDSRGPELAAVIVEPLLLGAGGMRVWDAGVLRAIANRLHCRCVSTPRWARLSSSVTSSRQRP